MKPISICIAASLAGMALLLSGCGAKGQTNPADGAPPAAQVEVEGNADLVKVDHPEQYPLATAGRRDDTSELKVTGTVSADVSRNVPVVSMSSGRVVEIQARLGDSVKKGQLLMKVQSSDISSAFSDYHKAMADEVLSHAQLDRAQLLLQHGAVPQKDVEVAQDAEDKAKVDVATAIEKLHVLGADLNHPSGIVDIVAPASGVIVEQNVTAAAGVKTLDNSPNLFTIADLSQVWIVCDVYENDLAAVREGEYADIRLNAYPDKVFRGRVDNISPILDPALRTAKVRLEVPNPGIMRFGMFVTATFHGQTRQVHAVVPASAVLHLHDRDWVYTPAPGGHFQRVAVAGGNILAGNMQEILSGLKPGQQVVSNALVLQNSVEQ